MTATPTAPRVSYAEMARFFVRLSLTAFGGPVAHIAIAEEEIVHRRRWLTHDHYLDLIAATNLIPGPNSTEVMIHVGYTLRGIPGAILAGACFITPASLVTLALAILYVSSGKLPQAGALLWGIKPVVVAIIANAAYRLLKTALKTRELQVLFALSLAAVLLLDVPDVVIMIGAGVLYALYKVRGRWSLNYAALALFVVPPTVQVAAVQVGVWDLFFYFLKIGSVLFGSGYVLIAYIQQDLVNTFRWLTSQQLLDAVAIGQVTPGPVSTTAAVVGYIVSGLPGAVLATLGIFLPSFVLVILTAPLIPKMRRSRFLSAFLSGVNVGVVAAILVTLFDLARAALLTPDGSQISLIALALAGVALALLVRTKINATWLIAVGGVIGLLAGH
jgi:chromate transporter